MGRGRKILWWTAWLLDEKHTQRGRWSPKKQKSPYSTRLKLKGKPRISSIRAFSVYPPPSLSVSPYGASFSPGCRSVHQRTFRPQPISLRDLRDLRAMLSP
jgi:hypothetical protein